MQIFETDTALGWAWNGTVWYRITPGFVGGTRYGNSSGILATSSSTTGTETLTGMSTGSVYLEAERAYRVSVKIDWDSTTAAASTYEFAIKTNDIAGNPWTVSRNHISPAAITRLTTFLDALIYTGATAGYRVFVLTVVRRAGTGQCRVYKDTTTTPYIAIELMGAQSLLTDV